MITELGSVVEMTQDTSQSGGLDDGNFFPGI
jgi:hypothetical protein